MKSSLILMFVLCVNFLFGQKTSAYTFYLCGNTFRFDSLSVYNEWNGLSTVGSLKHFPSGSFKGMNHIERSEMQTEDPNNPGTFYESTQDSLTSTYYVYNIFDTLTYSSLKNERMYVVSEKDTFPVCEVHLKCDSCESEYGFMVNMEENDGKKFFEMYDQYIVPEGMLNVMKNSSSKKFFITEIYFWDWKKKKKINLDFSFYVTK